MAGAVTGEGGGQGLVIDARGLSKSFRAFQSRAGLGGALQDLFVRRYRTVTAVDAIDLQVAPGEMVGYIGPNGAGKSTTIKMFSGILVPSAGQLLVNGMVPHRDRERFARTIGVVFGQRSQLWWDIAVRESFHLLRRIYRIPEETYRHHFPHLAEVLELEELLDQPVRKLSLGQRMRCELGAALLHNPPLLFLDEPTIGLDVVVKLRIREFLKEINTTYGTTVLLTTHDLTDIEALCPRVVILDRGHILYDGELAALKSRWAGGRTARVTFERPVTAGALAVRSEGLPVAWEAENELTWLCRFTDDDLPLARILSALMPDCPVHDVEVAPVRTEEIIRRIYQAGAAQPAG